MNTTEELKQTLIQHHASYQREEAMRKEWNKFARLCLKDGDYDKETIAFVLHVYRGWDLSQETSKLSYASTLLRYAHHIINY
jgi:hypothetical protein